MTMYRIVCKVLATGDDHIEKVGITDEQSGDKATDSATPKKINELIGNGHKCFVTNEAGKQVEVDQFGDDFIRTKADGEIRNNLRHLRDCNFKS